MPPVRRAGRRVDLEEREVTTDDLIEAFELMETWEERYELIGELERELVPIPESEKTDEALVKGCNTRTWLSAHLGKGDPRRLEYRADAEGPLVRGLVAVLLLPFQGKTPEEVLATDPRPYIDRLGLEAALSPTRQAGMGAFLERVRTLARRAQVLREEQRGTGAS